MPHTISENILKILICPNCGQALVRNGDEGVKCDHCSTHYRYSTLGALDLRLQRPKTIQLGFELGTHLPAAEKFMFTPLTENNTPQVDFSNADVPFHLTKEILTYFPKARSENSLMLDLGCGDAIHRSVGEFAGFEYVGLDYGHKAPILGDAHSLPFQDNSFEFILSIAVLEHIRYPFVMMREVYRVLQPGGWFIGTVAFLEPYHLDSYYHHSHLGTLNSLQYAGFNVQRIAPGRNWNALRAQAFMTLFCRMPRSLIIALISPLQFIHKAWWRLRHLKNPDLNLNDPIRDATGVFTFIATKETPYSQIEST